MSSCISFGMLIAAFPWDKIVQYCSDIRNNARIRVFVNGDPICCVRHKDNIHADFPGKFMNCALNLSGNINKFCPMSSAKQKLFHYWTGM